MGSYRPHHARTTSNTPPGGQRGHETYEQQASQSQHDLYPPPRSSLHDLNTSTPGIEDHRQSLAQKLSQCEANIEKLKAYWLDVAKDLGPAEWGDPQNRYRQIWEEEIKLATEKHEILSNEIRSLPLPPSEQKPPTAPRSFHPPTAPRSHTRPVAQYILKGPLAAYHNWHHDKGKTSHEKNVERRRRREHAKLVRIDREKRQREAEHRQAETPEEDKAAQAPQAKTSSYKMLQNVKKPPISRGMRHNNPKATAKHVKNPRTEYMLINSDSSSQGYNHRDDEEDRLQSPNLSIYSSSTAQETNDIQKIDDKFDKEIARIGSYCPSNSGAGKNLVQGYETQSAADVDVMSRKVRAGNEGMTSTNSREMKSAHPIHMNFRSSPRNLEEKQFLNAEIASPEPNHEFQMRYEQNRSKNPVDNHTNVLVEKQTLPRDWRPVCRFVKPRIP